MKLRGHLPLGVRDHFCIAQGPVELDCQDVGPQRQAVLLQVPREEAFRPQVNVVVTSFSEVRCAKLAQVIALDAADHRVDKVQHNVGARPTHDEPLVEGNGGRLFVVVSDEIRIAQVLP